MAAALARSGTLDTYDNIDTVVGSRGARDIGESYSDKSLTTLSWNYLYQTGPGAPRATAQI